MMPQCRRGKMVNFAQWQGNSPTVQYPNTGTLSQACEMGEKKPTSEELQVEVLKLRKLADRLKKRADELAIRSAELEKLVQRTKRRSPEIKPGR
jgi:hypothetical protein